jgi:hypothetical protein
MSFVVKSAVGAVVLVGVLAVTPAFAADLPAIKAGDKNKVAACVTPGRLMAFTKARNEKLDAKFETIAVDYMRHGEELGLRWDIAYFQMLLETANLGFGGDVKPKQNNFAGLGATGNGERGESFKDVSTGVRAHLEHLVMYTGDPVANPVAERTRKVQEWGVLTEWQKTIKGPMTFTQLARKWAPPARKYAQDIESVADSFTEGACKAADPRPELVAMARAGRSDGSDAVKIAATGAAAKSPTKDDAKATEKVSGTDLAKRAVDAARSEGTTQRNALGAGNLAKPKADTDAIPAVPFALINPVTPEPEAAASASTEKTIDSPAKAKTQLAAATGAAKTLGKPETPSSAKASACKVFTASYGGAKAIIIKADRADGTHYTVLDVNEGVEAREAEAYINAYAPGGKQVGSYKSQTLALDKAFELCPEG